MKAINRLYKYFEFKNIKPTKFERDFGISNGYFGKQSRRDSDIGSGIIEIILANCRDLNAKWLLTGEGEMLNNDDKININGNGNYKSIIDIKINELTKEKNHYQIEIDKLKIQNEHFEKEISHLKEQIKLKDQIIDLLKRK